MTNNSFTMTAHQYVKFTSSPFVMQMYVDGDITVDQLKDPVVIDPNA